MSSCYSHRKYFLKKTKNHEPKINSRISDNRCNSEQPTAIYITNTLCHDLSNKLYIRSFSKNFTFISLISGQYFQVYTQSYTWIEQSSPADTTFVPSFEYFAPQTWSVCCVNVFIHCLVPTFQIFTVLSELQLTAWLSGPKQTDKTHPLWPDSVPTRFACFASYTEKTK